MTGAPRTLFDKVWDSHVAAHRADGQDLLWIDRHFLHEGSHHAFGKLAARSARVARPDLTFGVADHYVPTRGPITDPVVRDMVERLQANTARHGVRLFGPGDLRQGIVHVAGPELGLTLPGLTVVCGDSHTSTHGAYGAIAFGIGASDVAHVLMTQTLWQRRPKRLLVRVDGRPGAGVTAKDIALSVIARLGADGAQGHAIEYAGEAVRALSMQGRLTLCNLSIESGARCGMVAPDDTTFADLRGRPFAPVGPLWEQAERDWRALPGDADAAFDRVVALSAAEIVPVVSWGTNPEDVLPVTARVPDPARMADPGRAAHVRDAIDYMGLRPGQALTELRVDRVFIGSCTNSRIEDLRAAAAVLAGRRASVPGLVSPGSAQVKQQAEEEGLDRIFTAAGLDWGGPGCSMCVGMNGDMLAPGERCASTTNRNFKGRQGPGSRTHLMSPAMAAAAALTGFLTDVRALSRDPSPEAR
ncbi:3-isopropylmalate dehydratase subunit LeuC [Rhodovastum atsumiense]|uniref:3-isopropylmalate dehydratase large subunit n=1 Tax=Rhodovastum atsumiense TaxID=504468 RepID=A0A5M6IUF8_9PROT|nr:3-isopropylmalate dehydratase large subunit [Rhodovastum atsumiense]KAA5611950.1 3-isopropylmalate dehydratase large subunit [Rhodovastum atsumiense]CAH2598716.1 3-isopropylmalate dehydratase subunit LeuC [Rhodovastum atsumiense]